MLVFSLGVTHPDVAVPLAGSEVRLEIGRCRRFSGVPQIAGIAIVTVNIAGIFVGHGIVDDGLLRHGDVGQQVAARSQAVHQIR